MEDFISKMRAIVDSEVTMKNKTTLKSRILKHSEIQSVFARVKFGFLRKFFLKRKLQFLHMILHQSARMFVLRRAVAMAVFVFVTAPMLSFLMIPPSVSMADFNITVSAVSGLVEVQRGTEFFNVENEQKLLEGDRLVLAESSFVEFYMPTVGLVRAKGGSDFNFVEVGDYFQNPNIELKVNNGTLWVNTHEIHNSAMQLKVAVAEFEVPLRKNSLLNIDYNEQVRLSVLKNRVDVSTVDGPVDTLLAGQVLKSDKLTTDNTALIASNNWIKENLSTDKSYESRVILAQLDKVVDLDITDLEDEVTVPEVETLVKKVADLNKKRSTIAKQVARLDQKEVQEDVTEVTQEIYNLVLDAKRLKVENAKDFEEIDSLNKVLESELNQQRDLVEYLSLQDDTLTKAKSNLSKAKVASGKKGKKLTQMQEAQQLLLDFRTKTEKDLDTNELNELKEVLDEQLLLEDDTEIIELESESSESEIEGQKVLDVAQENLDLLQDLAKVQDDIEVLEEIEVVKEVIESSVDTLADTYKFEKPESDLKSVGTVRQITPELKVVKENLDLNLDESLEAPMKDITE